jgi:hypothetical protein
MWKSLLTALTFFCLYNTHAQTVTENLLAGDWYVVKWETSDRLLDFEDSAVSIKYMVDNFKQKNKVLIVQKTDSMRISQELHRILNTAQALRFRLSLNRDKSFIWTGDSNAQYKGTYSLSSGNQELVLTSLDGNTKAYRTMPLKLHSLQTNQMIIEIPSEEPGLKQSRFTLKRQ